MSNEQINHEMKEALGQVPTFFQEMPNEAVPGEWELFKRYVLNSYYHTYSKRNHETINLPI